MQLICRYDPIVDDNDNNDNGDDVDLENEELKAAVSKGKESKNQERS